MRDAHSLINFPHRFMPTDSHTHTHRKLHASKWVCECGKPLQIWRHKAAPALKTYTFIYPPQTWALVAIQSTTRSIWVPKNGLDAYTTHIFRDSLTPGACAHDAVDVHMNITCWMCAACRFVCVVRGREADWGWHNAYGNSFRLPHETVWLGEWLGVVCWAYVIHANIIVSICTLALLARRVRHASARA